MKNAVEAYPIMWTQYLSPCPNCDSDHRSRISRKGGTESQDGNRCVVTVECPEGDFEADFNVDPDD